MEEKYDVIIIGAGVAGLVCGCYLAKSGLKVLIIDQQNKPGGYCTSFERKGYRFDVGVHYLGSLKDGVLKIVFDELGINLRINRVDPSDKIILPENIIYIRSKVNDTIQEFKKSFPAQNKNIDKFFNFILAKDFLSVYSKVRKLTFSQVLDSFFDDYRIKSVISLLLGNIGLSAKVAAAVPAIILFRVYILDCGYYPIGGMQAFPDELARKFHSFGGKLLLSRKVTKIITKIQPMRVILNNGVDIKAERIVSNSDAFETFEQLLDVKAKEVISLRKATASSSMFLVYLGLRKSLHENVDDKANVWYFSSYDIDEVYSYTQHNLVKGDLKCLLCSFPSAHDPLLRKENKSTAILFIHAPFRTEDIWNKNKHLIADKMVSAASKIIEGLPHLIDLQIIATPNTFFKYTSNKNGSFVGWLSTLDQIKTSLFPQRTSIPGCYLVGHWSSIGYPGYGGVPNVVFSGRRGAALLLADKGYKWGYKEIKL